eukprot:TRINITY_DN6195_c0_g1_i1.p1 TRINITY_DN6195_c0_g1~~TRINITY_DN6195_c0_g1_i1.p1  ORF type:complete len:1370 (-),score=221.56 TRINITY_DN6195_c0_g1_i1:444-4553(-)
MPSFLTQRPSAVVARRCAFVSGFGTSRGNSTKSGGSARHVESASGGRGGGFLVPRSQRNSPRSPFGRSSQVLRLSASELSAAVRVHSQGPNAGDLRMWREYAEAVLFHAGSLTPKHLAFITNGFARAEVPDRDVFRRLADRGIDQVHDFEPREIALFLNAYAKLAFRDLALFEEFSKSICRSPSADIGYGQQQMALVVNAYARLDLADVGLFQTLSSWITRKAAEFPPQGISMVANAYAKTLIKDVSLFKALAPGISLHINEFTSQHIANMLNAYAKLQIDDRDTIFELANKVPAHATEFRPMEVAAIAGALTSLEVGHRQALKAIGAVVRQNAGEFRARQLATSLHAFSSLTTAYGSLFVDVAPHVIACTSDADTRGLTTLLCAYARAGEPESSVIETLVEHLETRVSTLTVQPLVNLFYACGRLGLHRETLTRNLAEHLLPFARTLSPQHVANSVFAIARLGLGEDSLSRLLSALQARIVHGDSDFEPQHCANMLYGLATLHGMESTLPDFPAAPPHAAVAAIVERVLVLGDAGEWSNKPQLLASVCSSCARLGETPAPLFVLASRVMRDAELRRPSPTNLADLLAAFVTAGFFELEFYSWALSNLPIDKPGGLMPTDALFVVVEALDHANHAFVTPPIDVGIDRGEKSPSWQRAKEESKSDDAEHGDIPSVFFPDCPSSFRQQALKFYVAIAREFLSRARILPAEDLERLAVPFARAQLLAVPPFDLLSAASKARVEKVAVAKQPKVPLSGGMPPSYDPSPARVRPLQTPTLSDGRCTSDEVVNKADTIDGAVAQETLHDRLLSELDHDCGAIRDGAIAQNHAETLAQRLALYASFFQAKGVTVEKNTDTHCHVPAAVLDPIVKRISDQLITRAPDLAFADIAAVAETLTEAGLRPRAVMDALAVAAESRFPPPPSAEVGSREEVAQVSSAVASLVASLVGAGGGNVRWGAVPVTLRDRVTSFAQGFGTYLASSSSELGDVAALLDDRPLRTLTVFIAAISPDTIAHEGGGPLDKTVKEVLAAAVQHVLLPRFSGGRRQQEENSENDSSCEIAVVSDDGDVAGIHSFYDLCDLLVVLLPLARASAKPSASCDRSELSSLCVDAASLCSWLLVRTLSNQSKLDIPLAELLDIVGAFVGTPPSLLDGGHLELLATVAERMASNSQSLGPSGLASCLHTFGRMRLLVALHHAQLSCQSSAAEVRRSLESRARAACNLHPLSADEERNAWEKVGDDSREKLPRMMVSLLRSLLVWTRRLTTSEASQVAHFCAEAMDAQAFSDSDRAEVTAGLGQILERLCAQRRHWSVEDTRLVAGIGTLLRSEYPELLRVSRTDVAVVSGGGTPSGGWVSRSVVATLEDLRGSRDGMGR